MPTIHLKYGGSTAARTLACPAWQNLKALAPDIDRTSPAAERGTMLHDIMETIYTDPESTVEELCKDLDQSDRDAIDYAYNTTEALLDKYLVVDIITEEMLVMDENIGGSADMLASGPEVVLVIDYKFGFMPVTDTSQFKLYALAGMHTPSVKDMFQGKRVISAIVQPAVNEAEAIEHEHSLEELQAFHLEFARAVKLAEAGADQGNPGEHCKYCPAAPYCPAKQKTVAGFLATDPKVPAQLADGMALVAEMKEHIKAIESELFSALESNIKVPGWKLVLKQARRYWVDEKAAWRKLRYSKAGKPLYIEESLRSPAQVEKALKKAKLDPKKILDGLIDSKSSGTTIAPASDKRAAVEKEVVPAALSAIIDA